MNFKKGVLNYERLLIVRYDRAGDFAGNIKERNGREITMTNVRRMGREAFARNHGIDMNRNMTVIEFIKLTENAYGRNVICKLKKYYN